MTYRIGVVGYSGQKFDTDKARQLIATGIDALLSMQYDLPVTVEIVSGLTDLGVPAIAYRYAVEQGYRTVGVAAKKAANYDLFPVDEKILVGENWGDESPTFLAKIDAMLKVGGGKQSEREFAEFAGTKLSLELKAQ